MECHNPLNRGVHSARRGEGAFRSKTNKTENDLLPDMKYQPPFARSGGGGNRRDIPRSRSEQFSSSSSFSSSRSSSERNFFSDTKKPSRGDYPTPSRYPREERSEGIFARETDRSRFPPKQPARTLEFTPKEKPQEKEEELEPWEIERAKNRANRLNWSLSRTNGTSTPSSTSSTTTTTSTSTPSPTSAENSLCASMAQLKTDDSPVVLHGQLAKLPTPSTLPSAPGSGRRYIDPERQAEIDAQFGMSAEVDTSHMLELYELDTVDPDLLLPMLGPHVEGLYQISQNQCVVIFDNKSHAQELLRKNQFVAGRVQALHPLRLQQYSHLLPKKFRDRPETTTKLARRIIFHNLSIRTERTPEDKARREAKTQPKVDTSAWE